MFLLSFHLHSANGCLCLRTMFTARRGLLRHQKKHEAKTFTCDQFEGSYKTERGLKEHKSNVHSSNSYSCSSCPKIFTNKASFKQHMPIEMQKFMYS